jgi:hypothetical protein
MIRKIVSALILFLSIVTIGFAQDKLTLAILDLEPQGVSKSEAISITNRILNGLFQSGEYIVVERQAMEEILTEQGFQISGCYTYECAVQAGKLLGVQRILIGSFEKIEQLYSIKLQMIDVQTGLVVKTASANCTGSIEEVTVKATREAVLGLISQNSKLALIGERKPPKYLINLEGSLINGESTAYGGTIGLSNNISSKFMIRYEFSKAYGFYWNEYQGALEIKYDESDLAVLGVTPRYYFGLSPKTDLYAQITLGLSYSNCGISGLDGYNNYIDTDYKFLFYFNPAVGFHLLKNYPISLNISIGYFYRRVKVDTDWCSEFTKDLSYLSLSGGLNFGL